MQCCTTVLKLFIKTVEPTVQCCGNMCSRLFRSVKNELSVCTCLHLDLAVYLIALSLSEFLHEVDDNAMAVRQAVMQITMCMLLYPPALLNEARGWL